MIIWRNYKNNMYMELKNFSVWYYIPNERNISSKFIKIPFFSKIIKEYNLNNLLQILNLDFTIVFKVKNAK